MTNIEQSLTNIPPVVRTGGKATITVTESSGTYLKQWCLQAIKLTDSQKILVSAGEVLSVQTWKEQSNHYYFTLEPGKKYQERDSHWIYTGHCKLEPVLENPQQSEQPIAPSVSHKSQDTSNTKTSPIRLLDAFRYYQKLLHQDLAIAWLDGKLSQEQREGFGERFRSEGTGSPTSLSIIDVVSPAFHPKGLDGNSSGTLPLPSQADAKTASGHSTKHPCGIWIWNLADIRRDYLETLKAVECQRVYLKVLDDASSGVFWAWQCSPEIIRNFEKYGIEVWGWGYIFDRRPSTDTSAIIDAIKKAVACGIKGFIFDVEEEVKNPATHSQLQEILVQSQAIIPVGCMGYTSFGSPPHHSAIPYKMLNELCDLQFPQIYFEKFEFGPGSPGTAENEAEVQACIQAHKNMGLNKPILPIWGSESDSKYPATASELQKYLGKYPGSSIWRAPDAGKRGEAWNCKYNDSTEIPSNGKALEQHLYPYQPAPLPLPFNQTLRLGDRGNDVYILICALMSLGFLTKNEQVKDEFDTNVDEAVKLAQRHFGIDDDGIVGTNTKLLIENALRRSRGMEVPSPSPSSFQETVGKSKPLNLPIQIAEEQLNSSKYQRFSHPILGDITITGGFMESSGHAPKPELKAIFLNGKLQTLKPSRRNIGIDYVVSDYKVRAWYGGTVTKVGREGGYGRRLHIKLDITYKFKEKNYEVYQAYAHNREILVKEGQVIEQGQQIAVMGGSGINSDNDYPPHVDLSTYMEINGSKVELNPQALDRQLNPQNLDEHLTSVSLIRGEEMVNEEHPVLRKGDGINFPDLQDKVKFLQQKLGFIEDQIDGNFGEGTEAAVKQFQREKGLLEDGIVGQNTWSELLSQPVAVSLPHPNRIGNFDLDKIVGSISFPHIRAVAQRTIPIILRECEASEVTDRGQIAYILATAEHESHLGELMVEKASGQNYESREDLGNTQPGDGPRFKGRGFVQITGRKNYTEWSKRLGIDLVENPEKATDFIIAAKILVQGMRDGTFTGVKLVDFISGEKQDFYNARKIVNRLDKAEKIAANAKEYLAVL